MATSKYITPSFVDGIGGEANSHRTLNNNNNSYKRKYSLLKQSSLKLSESNYLTISRVHSDSSYIVNPEVSDRPQNKYD